MPLVDLKPTRPPLIEPTVRKIHIRRVVHKPKIAQLQEKLVRYLVSCWLTSKCFDLRLPVKSLDRLI